MANRPRTHNDYTVGWVCALPKEQTAAIAMLDQRHDLPKLSRLPNDHNTYTLGSIGSHNIVVACLPKGKIGTVSAATVATQMVNTFPSIKFGLMVGIGGGVPPKVRLGDVVVGTPVSQYPGVVQWDLGKEEQGNKFARTGSLNNPPSLLLSAVASLESEYELTGSKIPDYLDEMVSKYPRLAQKYLRSESFQDVLYKADYDHKEYNPHQANTDPPEDNEEVDDETESCQHCDKTQIVRRRPRDMRVHSGLIASGNRVIKNATFRDKLLQDLQGNVLCIEMEAAGLMDNFPCIVIRGICDYADSHKNKVWQEHAAATAAAYAKELLGYVQPSDVDQEKAVKDILTGISSDVFSIKDDVSHTRSRLDKQEGLEILDWLSPIDYGPQQTDYLRRRQPGTGQWLLDSPEYEVWIKDPNKTLFCPGIPGAGKTILTSIVINDLEQRFRTETTTVVAYVYCNYKRQSEQTPESLLSSLLKQLAQTQRSLPDTLEALYKQHEMKRTRPSLEEISSALESVINEISRVFFIVDALDECQPLDGCRRKFLSAIFDLQAKTGVNIFATSRYIPDIIEQFVGSLSIEIRATEDDIRRYLHDHLSELPKCVTNQPDLQNEITTSITKVVNGMFLLAQLHLSSLIGKDTRKAIRKALQTLAIGSNTYDDAYESAMERIRAQPQGQAKRAEQVLSWIVCAKRLLKKQELQHALAVEPGEPELDRENIPEVEDTVSVCAGLVTIDEESGIVRLVHYTTQDYFARTQSKWFPDAQLTIVRACTTYLAYREFASVCAVQDKEFERRLSSYPLYKYAALNWGHHAQNVSNCQEVLYFLQQVGQVEASGRVLKRQSWRWQCRPKTVQGWTGLHLLASLGLDVVMSTILGEYNINETDSLGCTPLSYAAEEGHEAIVKLLLEAKANPNLQNKFAEANPNLQDQFDQTPLSYAAEKGHEAIVKLLLEAKANPNLQNELGRTPLSRTPLLYAITKEHEAIVKLLLAAGANPDLQDKWGETPLSAAANNGLEAMVKLLLAAGANPNLQDKDGRTPLSRATERGHEVIVRLLEEAIEKKAHVDAADAPGSTLSTMKNHGIRRKPWKSRLRRKYLMYRH
ncbi:hypothetical protein F5Y01DRAFT_301082 [Xylaria sp. FL0043]|nr:hypothetical protein F5Y01DRAFT_301082 [Xylaria sp. FL0043]